MPIDTRIDGDPANIRAAATWLNNSLAGQVDKSITDLFAVRDQADGSWQGDAGPTFRGKMDNAGRKANQLRADAERAAQTFNSYADDLTTAQSGMARARDIALSGGLQLDGDTILDPGPGSAQPTAPTGAAVTADQVTAYNTQVTAYEDHQAKLAIYAQAEAQAKWSSDIWDGAKETGKNAWDDLVSKVPIHVADFVNEGVIGGLAATHTSILKKQAEFLREQSEQSIGHYLKTPGGTPESKALNLESWDKYLEADKVDRDAEAISRNVEGKIPVVGLALTAADIGWDIHEGKPAGKAIISDVGGAWAAAEAGAAVGTLVGGPVGLVAGAVIGIGVGLVVSGGLDYAYDQLPKGVTNAIDGGFNAIGHGVGDAGSAVGDTAKKVWHSIF
jgi:uncharacterized protein YukE